MSEEIVKLRGRLSSEAMTAAQEPTQVEASSISFKPKEDPDAPPELQLEQDLQIFCQGQEQRKEEDKYFPELCSPKRSRTKSQDNQYTILGFLERKIRIRVMSQQFSDKLALFNSINIKQ